MAVDALRVGIAVATACILLLSVTFSGEVHGAGRENGEFFSNLVPRDHDVDGKQITLLAVDNEVSFAVAQSEAETLA